MTRASSQRTDGKDDKPVAFRIARVSERILPLRGGKEVHVSELTRQQLSLGHDVRVLFRCGDGESVSPAGSHRIVLPSAGRRLDGLAGTALFGAVAARVVAASPKTDIVHVHGDFSEALLCGAAGRRVGAATVLTVHGGLNPRYRRLSGRCFRWVDEFIALGDAPTTDLLAAGVPNERITTMSSGLNFQMLDAARAAAVREPGLVVSVGSLDAVKNHETVIEAFRSARTHRQLKLEIIGSGPLERQLKSAAAGIQDVHFSGQMARAQVYSRVAAADVFVIASTRLPGKGEGVPTALLEAMALGTPTLVSSDATPASVVRDRDAYTVFDPHAVASLSDLLVQMTDRRSADPLLGERGRSAVMHLGWPEVAGRVEPVYERAIATAALRAKVSGA